jgi:hypothetical protein
VIDVSTLAAVRNVVLALTAGIGAISVPLLVTLLSRAHDVRVKLLEKRTPKAIKDEIAALEELGERESQAIQHRLQTLTKQLDGARPLTVADAAGVERVATELGDFQFFLIGKGRGLYDQVSRILDLPKAPDPRRLSAPLHLLAGYRESLARQTALLELDSAKAPLDDGRGNLL